MSEQKIKIEKIELDLSGLIWPIIIAFVLYSLYNLTQKTLIKFIESEFLIENGNPWILEKFKTDIEKSFKLTNKNSLKYSNDEKEYNLYPEFYFNIDDDQLKINISEISFYKDEGPNDEKYLAQYDYNIKLHSNTMIEIEEKEVNGYSVLRPSFFEGDFIFKYDKDKIILYGRNHYNKNIELHLKQKFNN